ncbi:MAG: UbiD family decarboxylase [Elusimicrobia bacterium]|nr:UbiD family decarboxylase [Elusimicrobiota bacterium]
MTAPDFKMDIRSILSNLRRAKRLKVIKKKANPILETSTLIRKAEPEPLLLENVGGAAVAANLLPSRDALAERLGVDPQRFLQELGALLDGSKKRPGAGMARGKGFYGQVEVPKDKWGSLPFLTYYHGDGGPYLTSGVWIVQDPQLGLNLSYHRLMMVSPGRGTVRVVEGRGMDTAIKNCGGKAEAAICIGAPAHVLFAAALSPGPAVNELDLAAKLGKLELLRCKTVDLDVPASCEMVIEGRFTGDLGEEGPFVDITGTMDFVRQQPVFEFTRVACRKNPIHYAIVPGRSDHKTLMGIPKELDIYREANKVCRCLDVRITPGGASWLHAVIRIAKKGAGEGKAALEAAFRAHRSLKHCVVVDEDVDISDAAEVEWALATRFQADTDMLLLKDQPASSLDPSACHVKSQKSRSAKLGLDATVKSGDLSLFRKVSE